MSHTFTIPRERKLAKHANSTAAMPLRSFRRSLKAARVCFQPNNIPVPLAGSPFEYGQPTPCKSIDQLPPARGGTRRHGESRSHTSTFGHDVRRALHEKMVNDRHETGPAIARLVY